MSNVEMPEKLLKDVINPWLLGADPEFAVLTPPDKVVLNAGSNAVQTKAVPGEIGYDHSGRVWELRPMPSPSAYVVTTNLWKLLQLKEMEKLEKFKWKSGALGAPKQTYQLPEGYVAFTPAQYSQYMSFLNTSNHIGAQALILQVQQATGKPVYMINPDMLNQQGPEDTLGGHVHYGISQLNAAQRKALNEVTTGLLSLDILPHKENTRRLSLTQHSSPPYGHMNGPDAVRDCNGHVEYRCAPSWLDKPGQALAALTIYKLAGARPSSVEWPSGYKLKEGLLDWLEDLSGVDIDAWILNRFVTKRGFESIQADPASDFKPRWRREDLWAL